VSDGGFQFNYRTRSAQQPPAGFDALSWPLQRAGQTSKEAFAAEAGKSSAPPTIGETDEAPT
jgi:hypothetical protein